MGVVVYDHLIEINMNNPMDVAGVDRRCLLGFGRRSQKIRPKPKPKVQNLRIKDFYKLSAERRILKIRHKLTELESITKV